MTVPTHTVEAFKTKTRGQQLNSTNDRLALRAPSARRKCVRETLGVDSFGVPHTHDSRHVGYHEYEASTEIFLFVVVRGVPIPCRCPPRPPRFLEKGGTVVQYPKGAGRGRQ